MKVKELIEILQRYDPESKVVYYYDGYISPNRFREREVKYDEGRRDFYIEEWDEDFKKTARDWLDFAAKDYRQMNKAGDKVVLMDVWYDNDETHIHPPLPREGEND